MRGRLLPIPENTIADFHKSCVKLFDCPWVKYHPPEEVTEEIITRYRKLYESLNGPDPDKRRRSWQAVNDINDYMILGRPIEDIRTYIGHCILLIFSFDWDDGAYNQPISAILDGIETIANEYIPKKYRHEVCAFWGKFFYCCTIDWKYDIKTKICRKRGELFNAFRLTDGGIMAFFSSFAAVYNDRELVYITAQDYTLSQLMKCLMFVNDVFSYNKEIKENEVSNHLQIEFIDTNASIDLQLQETLQEISVNLENLRFLLPEQYPVYVHWIRGNMEWSFATSRYREEATYRVRTE